MAFDAHKAIEGHETKILAALGVAWPPAKGSQHIRCPLGTHPDHHPSWRWDDRAKRFFCTCCDGSIFDAIIAIRGGTFRDAVAFAMDVTGQTRGADKPTKAVPRNGHVNGNGHAPAATPITAPRPPRAADLRHGKHGEPSAVWLYTLADYAIVEVRARYDFVGDDGAPDKEVVPWTWDGQRWRMRQMQGPRPLYRLPDLLADPGAPVLITEGEKAADAGQAIFPDMVVTTPSGGAKAVAGMDWSPLAGRNVVIWPDNDAEGRTFAQRVAQLVHDAGAASIYIVQVPESWPPKCDLADELPDSIDLLTMIDEAPPWTPPNAVEDVAKYKFRLVTFSEIKPVTDAPWLIKHLLPAKGLACVYGAPSSGKSALVLHAMLHVAAGKAWAGKKVTHGAVIYVAAESGSGVKNRIYAAANKLALSSIALGLITVAPNLGTDEGDAPQMVADIQAQAPLLAAKPVAIVIDTLARTMAGADENSTRDMGVFVANAEAIARAFDCAAIIVHHSGKDESKGSRGSNALRGAVEAEWEVKTEDDCRRCSVTKMKDGPDDWTWRFAIDGVEIGTDSDGEMVTAAVARLIDDASRKDALAKPSETKKQKAPSPDQKALLDIISSAVCEAGTHMKGDPNVPHDILAISRDLLKTYAKTRGWLDDRENARQYLNKTINIMAGKGLIGMSERAVWVLK